MSAVVVERCEVQADGQPEYTVLPVPGDPLSFDVKGSDAGGGWWYRVYLGDATHLPRCECLNHRYRLLGTNQDCRHLLAARFCPACQGSGAKQVPIVNIITDRWHFEDRPCGECIGDGSRAAYLDVQALKAEWQERHREAA
jgi:hypothetical protein